MEKQERNIVHDKHNESAYRGIDDAGPRNGPDYLPPLCGSNPENLAPPNAASRRYISPYRA